MSGRTTSVKMHVSPLYAIFLIFYLHFYGLKNYRAKLKLHVCLSLLAETWRIYILHFHEYTLFGDAETFMNFHIKGQGFRWVSTKLQSLLLELLRQCRIRLLIEWNSSNVGREVRIEKLMGYFSQNSKWLDLESSPLLLSKTNLTLSGLFFNE